MTVNSTGSTKPELRRKTPLDKRGRGRPKKEFFKDEERYEVALVETILRTTINGCVPSRRQAAQRAVLLRDYDLQEQTTSNKPPEPEWAPTGHRHSPIKPSLKEGFDEYVYEPKPNGTTRSTLEQSTKRLEYKHCKWMKPNTPEGSWLDDMADAWMATVYPDEIRRKGLDPRNVIMTAAEKTGEVEFADSYLLPLLDEQEKTLRKK